MDVAESVNAMSSAMSSAMSIGAGRLCGALHGAMLALDMFFGRTTQAGPKAPKVNAVMAPLPKPAGSPVPPEPPGPGQISYFIRTPTEYPLLQ